MWKFFAFFACLAPASAAATENRLDLFNKENRMMKDVAFHMSQALNSACLTILYSTNSTWYEIRQIHLLYKSLATNPRFGFMRAESFQDRIGALVSGRASSECHRTTIVTLAWHLDTIPQLLELSKIEQMYRSAWIVFSRRNADTNIFLDEARVSPNTNLMIAEISDASTRVDAVYRVSPDHEVHRRRYATWTGKRQDLEVNFTWDTLYTNLEKVPLRAATIRADPISDLSEANGRLQFGGYFGKVYYELAERLNFTAVEVHNPNWGTGSIVNGSWTGLTGMLLREEIDISLGPMTYGAETVRVKRNLYPLYKTHFQIYFKSRGQAVGWSLTFQPFSGPLWIAVLVWVVVFAAFLNLFYRLGYKSNKENPSTSREFTFLNAFFMFFASLCQQCHHFVPRSFSCRLICMSVYFLSKILITVYSTVLLTNIALNGPEYPFTSMESMLRARSHRLITLGQSTDFLYFQKAKDEVRKGIFANLMEQTLSFKIHSNQEGLMEVCRNPKLVYFSAHGIANIAATEITNNKDLSCYILHLQKGLDTLFLTISVKEDFPYYRIFDVLLIKMHTTGILDKLRRESWPITNRDDPGLITISITDIVAVHIVLLFGCVFAAFIFVVEMCVHRVQRRKIVPIWNKSRHRTVIP